MVWGDSLWVGGTDWKAWIGRASKNSWAKMKGVFEGSGFLFNSDTSCGWEDEDKPFGTKRMSSHHVIGIFEYLLVLR